MMNAAAPKRDAPVVVLMTANLKNLLVPPYLKRGPDVGSPPKYELLMIFMLRL
jgi:hypothetical protein